VLLQDQFLPIKTQIINVSGNYRLCIKKFKVKINQLTNVTWSINPGSSTDIGQVLQIPK